MKHTKLSTVLVSSLFALSSMTFAASGQKPGEQSMDIGFDELKEACLNPSRFHNQVAPKNIQISCRDVQAKWVPDNDGALSLDNGRLVTASIQSDKYSSAAVTRVVPSAAQVGSCLRFKQVTETVDSIRSVTCEDIIAFTGNSVDFCAGAINTLRSVNPLAVTVAETGKVIDPCTLEAARPKQR